MTEPPASSPAPSLRPEAGTPAVSVLLPVRNAEATLPEALESIQRQSLAEWEVIAVNDGSRDRSGALLDRAASQDARVKVLHLADGRGIVAALELARRSARAPFLARMDADDRALPSRLEEQFAYLQECPDIGLCGTHVQYFPRGRVRAGARRYEAWLNSLTTADAVVRDVWVECPLAHPTFMMRRSALDRAGGYRAVGWPEDYDLVLRLHAAGVGLGVVPRVLLHWRESPVRLSRTDPTYAPEAFRAAKIYFMKEVLLPGRDGIVVWGAGPVGKAFARGARDAGIALRAFVDLDPGRIGQEIHGAPVVALDDAPRFRSSLHLAAVGREGAREGIRDTLAAFGWVEGEDFVAVA